MGVNRRVTRQTCSLPLIMVKRKCIRRGKILSGPKCNTTLRKIRNDGHSKVYKRKLITNVIVKYKGKGITPKPTLKNKKNIRKNLPSGTEYSKLTVTSEPNEYLNSQHSLETDIKKDKLLKNTKDDKLNKELKNLNIEISGFHSVVPGNDSTVTDEINASISEIVKTKSRATTHSLNYRKNPMSSVIVPKRNKIDSELPSNVQNSTTFGNNRDKDIVKSGKLKGVRKKILNRNQISGISQPTTSTEFRSKTLKRVCVVDQTECTKRRETSMKKYIGQANKVYKPIYRYFKRNKTSKNVNHEMNAEIESVESCMIDPKCKKKINTEITNLNKEKEIVEQLSNDTEVCTESGTVLKTFNSDETSNIQKSTEDPVLNNLICPEKLTKRKDQTITKPKTFIKNKLEFKAGSHNTQNKTSNILKKASIVDALKKHKPKFNEKLNLHKQFKNKPTEKSIELTENDLKEDLRDVDAIERVEILKDTATKKDVDECSTVISQNEDKETKRKSSITKIIYRRKSGIESTSKSESLPASHLVPTNLKKTDNSQKAQKAQKKDVYDFDESGQSSEGKGLSYKNSLNFLKSKAKIVKSKHIKGKKIMRTKERKFDSDSYSSFDEKPIQQLIVSKLFTREDSSKSSSDSGSDKTYKLKSKCSTSEQKLKKPLSYRKRHRMASLNALVKVQCLYENEAKTAQELGFVREPRVGCKMTTELRDPLRLGSDCSTEVDKETSSEDVQSDASSKQENLVVSRSLRNAPGIRSVGNLWDVDDSSGIESTIDNDSETFFGEAKLYKPSARKRDPLRRTIQKHPKMQSAKGNNNKGSNGDTDGIVRIKSVKRSISNSAKAINSEAKKLKLNPKRKTKTKQKTVDVIPDVENVVMPKRVASLNASAMLAVTYEVERHLDRCDSQYDGSSSECETEKKVTKKCKAIKVEAIDLKDEVKEDNKTASSTNVVIVQDTDVTITGVYVNSSLGSGQEAYCKMQYRVQSSVTEERLVKPASPESSQSYTPLSALSCMRPPDTAELDNLQQQQHIGSPVQHEATPHAFSNHISDNNTIDCESPFRYQPNYGQSSSVGPQPQSALHIQGSTSAFCPISQTHHDSGYYQPAGPLISPHLIAQPVSIPPKSGISLLPETNSFHLQPRHSQSSSANDSCENEIIITESNPVHRQQTFRFIPQGAGRPFSGPSMHPMHCAPYQPSFYTPIYSQHPPDVCYPTPYQSYYPPKVYSNAVTYGRRFMPETYYQPMVSNEVIYPQLTNASPHPSTGQIIPTVPGGLQHVDQYSPYYTGYSPGSGQCYSSMGLEHAYRDGSSYSNICPCPMQSCPKNAHTGPLIGSSKSGKGPVQSNVIPHAVISNKDSMLTESTAPIILQSQKNTPSNNDYKAPDTAPLIVVKPEESFIPHYTISFEVSPNILPLVTDRPTCEILQEKVVLAPHPNYTISSTKYLEPELSISPARGSTGLPIPPTQDGASQPSTVDLTLGTTTTTIRKARLGKNVAREMVKQSALCCQQSNIQSEQKETESPTQQNAKDQEDMSLTTSNQNVTTNDLKKDDHNNVKIECDDDVVFVDEVFDAEQYPDKNEKLSTTNQNVLSNKDSTSDTDKEIYEDDTNVSNNSGNSQTGRVRRRKIIEITKNPLKKSPANSYKNYIKPQQFKLNISVGKIRKSKWRSSIRKVAGESKLRHRKSPHLDIENKLVEHTGLESPKVVPLKESATNMNPNNIGGNHMKQFSEKVVYETNPAKELIVLDLETDNNDEIKSKKMSMFEKHEAIGRQVSKPRTFVKTNNIVPAADDVLKPVKARKTSKVTTNDTHETVINDENDNRCITSNSSDNTAAHTIVKKSKFPENLIHNNNNNISVEQNNNKLPNLATLPVKKSRPRGSRFGNKKRHKIIKVVQKVEEDFVPNRTTVTPKWSNGWQWEGDPYRGKVFLNSDDPQVIRTRYPAMRHRDGDVIRPRDCVLLRAGTKKNELPFVAKVASLWENPEDGEMMMSLLWYYRPEHTDQGRQPNDCIDEVFASRHLDHNSVACIEDKCYVLTFYEYCRYRRALRAIEQSIELPPSQVPILTNENQESHKDVPANTNGELVMFCRRVYEFRQKKLLKNPS